MMTWSVLSGYCAEGEGIVKLAPGHFNNAVLATLKLCGKRWLAVSVLRYFAVSVFHTASGIGEYTGGRHRHIQ